MNSSTAALEKQLSSQTKLLERIAIAMERNNEILRAMLSPEQRKALDSSAVRRLAKSSGPSQSG